MIGNTIKYLGISRLMVWVFGDNFLKYLLVGFVLMKCGATMMSDKWYSEGGVCWL